MYACESARQRKGVCLCVFGCVLARNFLQVCLRLLVCVCVCVCVCVSVCVCLCRFGDFVFKRVCLSLFECV